MDPGLCESVGICISPVAPYLWDTPTISNAISSTCTILSSSPHKPSADYRRRLGEFGIVLLSLG
jgi:hypothetical protein